MDLWFTEEDEGELRYGYAVENILFKEKSEFQQVEVIETKAYGKMLLIDGLVMITEHDEFVYHEMIAHVPALIHPDPKNVIVIGGGDGGTVRELLKHPGIDRVTLCEIDNVVIEASKKYFPQVAGCLDDDRVDVRVGDGVAYVKELAANSVDLILVDSTDPISVGEGLFSKEFYGDVASALKPDGLMACQSESPWYKPELLQRIQNNVRANFSQVRPYVGVVPTYPRGFWSWTMASQKAYEPKEFSRERLQEFSKTLRYLNADVLPAAFALPNFFSEKLS